MRDALPQTAKGRATRQRIVDVTTRLIMQRGVAAVSLDDVGDEAHVSRSQLYHYFDDKAHLLRAVVVSTTDLVLTAQAGHLEPLDSWAAIDRWFAHLMTLQPVPPRGCPLGSLVGQMADQGEALRGELAMGFARWESHLADGLARMSARGKLRRGADPQALATATLASIQGGLLLSHVHADPTPLRHALDGARVMLDAHRTPAAAKGSRMI